MESPLLATSALDAISRFFVFLGVFMTFMAVLEVALGFTVRYVASHDEEKMRLGREQMFKAAMWFIASIMVVFLGYWVKINLA